MKPWAPIFILFLGTSACSVKKEGTAVPSPATLPARNIHNLNANLRESLLKIQNESFVTDSCDTRDRELMLKVIEKVEAHAENIQRYKDQIKKRLPEDYNLFDGEEFVESIPLSEDYSLRRTRMNRPLKAGWFKLEYPGWRRMWEGSQKEDLSDEGWADLDYRLRQTLDADLHRRVGRGDVYTPYEKRRAINIGYRDGVKTCLDDANCSFRDWKDRLTGDLLENFEKNPGFDRFRLYALEADLATQRKFLEALQLFVKRDLSELEDERIPEVSLDTSATRKVFRVKVRGTALSQTTRDFVEKEIEAFWQAPAYRADIQWVGDDISQRFEFFFRPLLDRAFVVNQTLNLFYGDTVATLIHEFGHVLGFSDRYFEERDLETCAYRAFAREDEVMSAGAPGSVLNENDWVTLNKLYSENPSGEAGTSTKSTP